MKSISEDDLASFQRKLVTAIQTNELGDFLESTQGQFEEVPLHKQGLKTLEVVRADCLKAGKELVALFKQNGIDASFDGEVLEKASPQFQQIEISLKESNPDSAVQLLEREEFFTPFSLKSGAWTVYRHLNTQVRLTRKDEVTTRVVLSWQGRIRRSFLKRFSPNEYEGELLKVPSFLWPAIILMKSWRILRKRFGGKVTGDLGHWLGTPTGLLKPIFEAIDLGRDDVLVDLGCGDGRVLVEGVQFAQCRAVGVEINERLRQEAMKKVEEAGLDQSISIASGGIDSFDASQATVIFVFLPSAGVSRLLPSLLANATLGTRIVVHEQNALPLTPPPKEVIPIFSERSITLLHIWQVN